MKATTEKQSQQEPGEVRPLPRVSDKRWKAFQEWCEREFDGNWGMGFSKLIDDVILEPLFFNIIEEHEVRLKRLEMQSELKDEEHIKLLIDE